jgi:hypothetical protein
MLCAQRVYVPGFLKNTQTPMPAFTGWMFDEYAQSLQNTLIFLQKMQAFKILKLSRILRLPQDLLIN